MPDLSAAGILPRDSVAGALTARVWRPDLAGPVVAAVRQHGLVDLSVTLPTMADLTEQASPVTALRAADGPVLGQPDAVLANTPPAVRVLLQTVE